MAILTGWVMTVAILLAPATRVGYLLYPANLFVWGWMLGQAADPAVPTVEPKAAPGRAAGEGELGQPQSSSLSSKTSTEKGVVPAAVAGDTTTPTSQ